MVGALEGDNEGGVEGDNVGLLVGAAETALGDTDDIGGELDGLVDGSDEGPEEGSALLMVGTLEGDKEG